MLLSRLFLHFVVPHVTLVVVPPPPKATLYHKTPHLRHHAISLDYY